MASSRQRDHLHGLVEKGAPSNAFLWPIDMVFSDHVSDFGYIMPLRPAGYCSIVDLMTNRADPSFYALATAGFELAHNFRELHAKGLCYQDISFDNIFFHPETGHVLICDNDNVAVEGQHHHSVFGTPRFMAPEVVRKESVPSIDTDLFSLSVLLFYMLMIHHPLEGELEFHIKCLDLASMEKLYGAEPVFIFDPSNRKNRPVSGVHDNAIAYWPIYPQFIRDLFIQAFTLGISDPKNGRVREGEWRNAMIRLRDSIIYCNHCGLENLYDLETPNSAKNPDALCWSCARDIRVPPHISLKRGPLSKSVMLNFDSKLFPHHLDPDKTFDFHVAQAAITQHPSDPLVWGLTNQSEIACPGTQIDFGKISGEIRI
jgi:serine/threonine protein kinase